MSKMKLPTEIAEHLLDVFTELDETAADRFETTEAIQEVAYEEYPGFIPFTNGGYRILLPLSLNRASGGYTTNGNRGESYIQSLIDKQLDLAQEAFLKNEIPDIPLEEFEDAFLDLTLYIQYQVFFFSTDNIRNQSGKDEIEFFAGINTDFEYGRDSGFEVFYQRTVAVEDLTIEMINSIVAAMEDEI